jgi:hypothetical protein
MRPQPRPRRAVSRLTPLTPQSADLLALLSRTTDPAHRHLYWRAYLKARARDYGVHQDVPIA